MKASAYVSVFDDWELLRPSIASVAPYVDEIVVVDGAYRWMAPFFAASGRDPTRSDDRVRQALAPFVAKLRWINQLWDDEPAKRTAGYAACQHRHVWRVDSDEVLFVDEAALERHLSSGRAVAEMAMPIYVAPGFIRGRPGQPPEQQALLFDRHQVGPEQHLAYLWLVLPPAERARIEAPDPARISAAPIAFNAHLTHWRPPASALSRARFYVLNWLREPGRTIDWAPNFQFDPAAGYGPLFQAIPPQTLMELLLSHRIVAGLPEMEGYGLVPTPLTPAQEAVFSPCYAAHQNGLATLNGLLGMRPRIVGRGDTCTLDLSTPAQRKPFERDGGLAFTWSEPLAAVRAELDTLLPHAPWVRRDVIDPAVAGATARLALPHSPGALRQVLRIGAWGQGGGRFMTMRAGD